MLEEIRDDFAAPTRVSLETMRRVYTVEIPRSGLTLGEMWDEVLRPLLVAAGFSASAVDALVGDVDEGVEE